MNIVASSSNEQLYKWKVLATITLGTVMGAMDFSMVNLAFPKLTEVFHTSIDVVLWVTLAFTLSNTSLLLIVGRIGDLIGRKRLYIAGEIIFNCGILACAFSKSIGQLIGFRIVLGVGASMIFSSGPALLADAFPPKDLGKGMGILNASISAGFIIGPVVGGLLLNWIDWRSIFYVRLPFGVLATAMSMALLRPDRIKPKRIRFDKFGMLFSVLGLFLLVFGVNQVSRLGLYNTTVYLLVGSGLILLILFVIVEQRVAEPILDFSLFRNRLFSFFSLSLFVFFIAVPIFVLILPFFFMDGLGLDPSQSGLLIAISSVISIAVGPISGVLSDRYGEVWLASLGVGIVIVAYNLVRIFDTSASVLTLVPVLGPGRLRGGHVSDTQQQRNSSRRVKRSAGDGLRPYRHTARRRHGVWHGPYRDNLRRQKGRLSLGVR